MKQSKFNYIDLFAGCGGLSLGLHKAGWDGIFAIEKSKFAFETLQHNLMTKISHFKWPSWLPKTEHDINVVLENYSSNLKELRGKIDMVTGGPPCQGFSTAGKRNEEDNRNKLINSYIKFIKLVQPKMLFFENVKGFTLEFDKNSSKGKRYSDFVVTELKLLGYNVDAHLINFSEYGVPQKRCRFILIGIREDVCTKINISASGFFKKLKEDKNEFLTNNGLDTVVSLEAAISDLLKTNGTEICSDNQNFKMGLYSKPTSKYQIYLRKGIDENVRIPDSHRYANHSTKVNSRFEFILRHAIKGKSLSKQFKEDFSIKKHTLIPLHSKEPAPTITTLPDDYVHYSEPRILTVREYARIQSFPDTYEIKGKYTTGGKARVLEVPRYTQIGNAIPPLFGEQCGITLSKMLNGK